MKEPLSKVKKQRITKLHNTRTSTRVAAKRRKLDGFQPHTLYRLKHNVTLPKHVHSAYTGYATLHYHMTQLNERLRPLFSP